jgi:GMP synthase (glutamine-hydrolysing)
VRVLAIVHQSGAGPGVFVDPIRATGADLHCWRLPDEGPPWCDPRDYAAVLTLGGAMHPDEDDRYPWLAEEKALLADLLGRRVPLLGVCLGAQLLCEAAGAPARRAWEPEIGWHAVELTAAASHDPVLGPLAPGFDALEWHGYELRLPPSATPLARSANCLQAVRIGDAAWAIQFRAEVTLEDFESWLDAPRSEDHAVAPELAPYELGIDTRRRIAAWNELGRGLCDRFLGVATAGRPGEPRLRLHRR